MRAPERFSTSEIRSYGAIFLALVTAAIVARVLHVPPAEGSGASDGLFGFTQLTWQGCVLAAALGVLVVLGSRLPARFARLALAALFGVVFFVVRSWFINPDGALFPMKFLVDVPARGFHATHDEMWELYVHSRFWFYTNEYFGWSVTLSYQVLSCVAGSVFVLLLLAWWQRLVAEKWPWAFLASVSGGYMQLFFGDAENYTLTTTIVMAYFLASLSYFEKRTSVILPWFLLAVALTFHLESGFLLPSLVWLTLVAWKRGQQRQLALAISSFVFVIAGTLLFFDVQGLPIGELFTHSHAFGDGGHFLLMLATPAVDYYVQIANLAFLLVPAWVLVVPLLAYRRIPLDDIDVHLLVGSGAMTAFVLGWKAQLGVYNDWNLFAMAAVPISLLVWRGVFGPSGVRTLPWPIAALVALFLAQSCSWIVANHLL